MICLIALFVFALLSVFSASYRPLARRAFDCVFRRLTLRPCDTGFDTEMKSKITAKLLAISPKTAKLVNKNFEALSWAFTVMMFASLFFSAQGLYNWYYFGNCNGPQTTAFCIFNAFSPKNVTLYPQPSSGNPYFSPMLSGRVRPVEVVEFGCFSCPFTKQAEPLRAQVESDFGADVEFYYRNFPLPNHPNSREAAIAAQCAYVLDPSHIELKLGGLPEKYWKFHDLLFESQDELRSVPKDGAYGFLTDLASKAGYSGPQFRTCLANPEIAKAVDDDFTAGLDANVQGTPTFFVKNRANESFMTIVGPQPYEEVKKVIQAAIEGRVIHTTGGAASSGSCPVDFQ